MGEKEREKKRLRRIRKKNLGYSEISYMQIHFGKEREECFCEYNPRRHLGSLYVIYADSHTRISLTTLIPELDFSQLHLASHSQDSPTKRCPEAQVPPLD